MNIRGFTTRFRRSEDGSILLMVAISFAAFFGFIALSFDLGRVAVTQTELQSYADHVALAAAGELDGSTNSITRATAAAARISDRQTFGDGGASLSDRTQYSLRFLRTIPARDTDPITLAHVTSDARLARYVEVTINSRRVDMAFGGAVLALTGSGANEANVAATAVAGYALYACDITPMMFCIPDVVNWKADANKGQMILLRAAGSNSAWGPGNFGFLGLDGSFIDPEGPCAIKNNGGNLARCLLGAVSNITQCIPQRGVSSDPGQSVGINRAPMNYRFDIYPSGSGSLDDPRTNRFFAPAPNVLKKLISTSQGNSSNGICVRNNPSISNAQLLPRGGVSSTNRFGSAGDWEGTTRAAYIAANYPGFAGVDPFPAAKTRYEYYLAEIAANPAADPRFANSILGTLGAGNSLTESARPSCSPHVASPERRVLIAAGVDCVANPINGKANNIPVQEFVKLFMTEPVGSGSEFDIYTEVVGTAEGAADGQVRRVVELVR